MPDMRRRIALDGRCANEQDIGLLQRIAVIVIAHVTQGKPGHLEALFFQLTLDDISHVTGVAMTRQHGHDRFRLGPLRRRRRPAFVSADSPMRKGTTRPEGGTNTATVVAASSAGTAFEWSYHFV